MVIVPLTGLYLVVKRRKRKILRVIRWWLPKPLQTMGSLVTFSGYTYNPNAIQYV